jgi:hypothetical protein
MGTASIVGLLTGVLSIVREPVRLTLRAWEFGLSTAAEAARLGAGLIEPDRPAPPPAYEGNGVAPDFPVTADAPPAVPDELVPDHVDEGLVLVAETAEEGAEDGAGPELHVDPPWDGYDEMTAADIRARLSAASAAEAAAVELYEATRKSRRSVLEAAERALRP